jgi:hypothetical protein
MPGVVSMALEQEAAPSGSKPGPALGITFPQTSFEPPHRVRGSPLLSDVASLHSSDVDDLSDQLASGSSLQIVRSASSVSVGSARQRLIPVEVPTDTASMSGLVAPKGSLQSRVIYAIAHAIGYIINPMGVFCSLFIVQYNSNFFLD